MLAWNICLRGDVGFHCAGAQYICFLSNIMGGMQATEDFVKYTIKEHCEGSEENRNAFLHQELMLVDECTKRAAEL